MISEALKAVAVLGAGGKMGRGIALLLLQTMSQQSTPFSLLLIDSNPEALQSLLPYLRIHLTRYAEKNIIALRSLFADRADLVSNGEIIRAFVEEAMDQVHCDTNSARAAHATLVFEAIAENLEQKVQVFNSVGKGPYFFTNTSSIPIHLLDEQAHLKGRIIGFHFYNPPAVQRLVELIIPKNGDPELVTLARELGRRMEKELVVSQDVAGFIGNGFLLREIHFACEKVHELSREYTLPEAICMVNRVTQDFLIRPMGIFQLVDYIGLDICQAIGEVMSESIPDELFQDPLIDVMIADDILGGQFSDGSQKNGFFTYDSQKRIYSPVEHAYQNVSPLDKILGPFPEGHASWKHLQNDPDRETKLGFYLENLKQKDTLGASLAQGFLKKLEPRLQNYWSIKGSPIPSKMWTRY